MLRAFILLAAVLLVSSSSAWALGGSGSVVVDIVGSKTDNTNVMSSGTEKIELEVIGSEAVNTTIGSPEKTDFHRHSCCDEGHEEKDSYTDSNGDRGSDNPWDGMHLGVDAWYNTFWYRDDINTPKWPQF
ncbi:MAG: hypothetical protein LUQ59_03915 [Methanothrix sp.]|nr:hypothetical protein [Methanothrix sp.]